MKFTRKPSNGINHWNESRKMKEVEALLGKVDNKGEYNGICNRTSCNNTPATWYNHSTLKHYCRGCASVINECNHSDAMRLYGHELCINKEENETDIL